jgi:hypothetical protein
MAISTRAARFLAAALAAWSLLVTGPGTAVAAAPTARPLLYRPGAVAVIPEDNRTVFYEAFDAAKSEIRIEICVLEDPGILGALSVYVCCVFRADAASV